MSSRRTILTNTFALYALQAANYLFPLVTIPDLLRVIGVSAYGEIAFTGSVVLALGVVVEFSFNYTATARIATRGDDLAEVSTICSIVMLTKLKLMLACTVALAAITLLVPALRQAWPLVVAQWPLLLGEVLFPVWLFQGLQRLTFVTIFHVISRVVTLALLFVFVRSAEDTAIAAAIQAVHLVIAGAVAQAVMRWSLGIRLRRPEPAARDALVQDSTRVFIGNMGGQVYIRTPMVLVGLLCSAPMVGAFAVASKITSLLSSLASPVTQSLYPHFCTLAERDPGGLMRLRNRAVLGIGGAVSLVALAVAASGDWIVRLLSGADNPVVSSMLWLFWPVVVVTAMNMMLAKLMLALRRFEQFRRMYLASSGVFVVLSIPFTLWLQAYGTIVTGLIVEAVVFIQCLRIVPSAPGPLGGDERQTTGAEASATRVS